MTFRPLVHVEMHVESLLVVQHCLAAPPPRHIAFIGGKGILRREAGSAVRNRRGACLARVLSAVVQSKTWASSSRRATSRVWKRGPANSFYLSPGAYSSGLIAWPSRAVRSRALGSNSWGLDGGTAVLWLLAGCLVWITARPAGRGTPVCPLLPGVGYLPRVCSKRPACRDSPQDVQAMLGE